MGCEQYRDKLELVISLENKEPSLEAIIAHIKGCPQCAEDFANIYKLDEILRDKMEEVDIPSFLLPRLKTTLRQAAPSPKTSR